MDEENQTIKESLVRDMADIAWSELKMKCPIAAIIWVDSKLDLLEAGQAIAEDRSELVSDWMNRGLIRKLSNEDISAWDKSEPMLKGIFIKPFVLVQAKAVQQQQD